MLEFDIISELVEECSEAVHKAYCEFYKKRKGKEYWTKGDYTLLNDETKEIDRQTVRAVLKVVRREVLSNWRVNGI